jgi:urocanate hydratase
MGRTKITLAFNEMIKKGAIKGPVVISRDHHDVSGTDSPFRETSNVYDGSAFTAGKTYLRLSKILTYVYRFFKIWLYKIVLVMHFEVQHG